MVIQRWQTLFLLVAAALMGIFCLTPVAMHTPAGGQEMRIFVKDAPVFMVLNILITLLLLIDIFQYKDLKRQMTLTSVCMLLIAAALITGGIILYGNMPDAEPVWCGGPLLPVFALIFSLMAYVRMRHDLRILRSYDRLR